MESFLKDVVKTVLARHTHAENLHFIVPGKRAGVFLKDEFIRQYQKTGFAPQFTSIETFIESVSGLSYANNIQLLFELYRVYIEQETGEKENFHSFSKWGQVLLQDFNEIDRYLVEPKTIFPYLASVKEIHHWFLNPEKTELQQKYIDFWNTLGAYYFAFKENLMEKGIGYQGMIYKEAIDNLEFYQQNNTGITHIFVGFNALNKAEEKIIQELLENGNTEIYWDIDRYFFDNEDHDAGLFIRKHLNSWKYFQQHKPQWLYDTFITEKNIQLIGIPKNVGQAKYVGKLLTEIEQQGNLQHAVVVLGDETLLTPVLNEIPATIEKVNITMGLPLRDTPPASLFSLYFHLYLHERDYWYYKDVLNLLTHPGCKLLLGDKAYEMITRIQTRNMIKLTPLQLVEMTGGDHPLITDLFTDLASVNPKSILEKCFNILYALKEVYDADKPAHRLDLEYTYRFYTLFNQLSEYINATTYISDIKTLYSIYRELISTETLDFQGEPLDGLQIMGMLESRNLDFETVILTSVNEGILPSGKSNNSFIPFDIKMLLEMPTYKEKDAVYTYHFYRLLQRAKNIYLLYNTEIADALKGGEKSRFIMQLQAERIPAHHVTEIIASPDIHPVTQDNSITKDELLINRLEEVAAKGFSPSSLTSYVRNPIDFYRQTVLGINTPEEVEETIAANTLGTILHNTLENLYKPFEDKYITVEDIQRFQQGYETELKKQFADVYKGADYSRGKNLLIYHVAQAYIKRFLDTEKELVTQHRVKIITIEGKYEIPVPGFSHPVILKGKVDRVDEIDGQLRIVDYKSGRVDTRHVEIVEWEEIITDYEFSKAFQVLAYAYMRNRMVPFAQATGGIISFKNLGAGFLSFCVKDKRSAYAKKEFTITQETLQQFEIQLQHLIIEILTPEIPFTEKEV